MQIRATQPLPEVTFDFDLNEGTVRDYPLDRYVSVIALAASERAQDGTERSLPIHVTAWEGSLALALRLGRSPRNGLMSFSLSSRSAAPEQYRSSASRSMGQ